MMSEQIKIEDYSEEGFWKKCKKHAASIGQDLMEKALQLYYALDSERCTLKQKSIIYGALAYLVSPIDAIPDLTPILGYTDDMGIIAAALVAVSSCIDEEVKTKAQNKVKEWFH